MQMTPFAENLVPGIVHATLACTPVDVYRRGRSAPAASRRAGKTQGASRAPIVMPAGSAPSDASSCSSSKMMLIFPTSSRHVQTTPLVCLSREVENGERPPQRHAQERRQVGEPHLQVWHLPHRLAVPACPYPYQACTLLRVLPLHGPRPLPAAAAPCAKLDAPPAPSRPVSP
eukprot:CAMPEP_0174737778 /NCGR_PEP_ID=MMETSP1094-20130205/68857_1 /TAXON_ID=156173 /ORGANISM="Chrysochromulina brevifilum, Strain UTEX LB 985" /LENGTH=172 /DNA_ID=CAMNT_0015941059 /DNA_START=115 /DNA_END=630 /DNA_ORIENTATION=+